jgi:hypothetical protein
MGARDPGFVVLGNTNPYTHKAASR